VAQLSTLGRFAVMKLFTRIHIIFAVFLVLAILTDYILTERMIYLHENSPSEFHIWQPRISAICFCVTVGVPVMWLLFAIYHLAAVLRKRAKHEH